MAQAKTAVPRMNRALHIVYQGDSKMPDFKFEGVWTGFEVSTVVSNLRRAYQRVKRDQRRAASSENSTTLTKEAA